MRYARVHDRTVAEDYYAAMAVIEKRLEPHLGALPEQETSLNGVDQRMRSNGSDHLLQLVDALETETLNDDQRALVAELRNGILALL